MLLKLYNKLFRRGSSRAARFGSDGTNPLRKGKRNFIFIHINKTAGTSICEHVGIPSIQHYTAQEVIKQIGHDQWNKAFSFSVVRNPWAKVLSQYNYRVKVNKNHLADGHLSFEHWIEKVYGESPDAYYRAELRAFKTQLSWLRDHNGEVVVNKIIKFESLAEDFSSITSIIGLSPVLPRLNATAQLNYRDFYSEHSKEIIGTYFKEDIDLWGWEY